MKKRIVSMLLTLVLLAAAVWGALPEARADSAAGDYGWAEMQDDVAMRVTQNGAEVTRLIVGETYQLQFWLRNISPYAITLPLNWDPAVVTVVDAQSGEPIPSGRKKAGEAAGFRAGSKCYESGYDPMTYAPLYWNGQPVYTSGEVGEGGYPYLNSELGHYRFFYYVSSPNAPAQAQLFLEVSFRIEAKGDPDFHLGSVFDGAERYDPASPEGLSVLLPGGDGEAQTQSYGSRIAGPTLTILTPEEYRQQAITPEDPSQMFPWGPTNPGGNTGGGAGQEKPSLEAELIPAQHLSCFPYGTAAETAAVLKNIGGKITGESDYILPDSLISDAVNTQSGKRALLVRMPDEILDKAEYALVFRLRNIDDMANRGLTMLYVETPWAFVGLNTAILAEQTADDAQARLCVRPGRTGGLSLALTLDGKAVPGFRGAALRIILPYDAAGQPEGTIPVPVGRDVFGTGTQPDQPMSLYTVDAAHGALIFLASGFGGYAVEDRGAASFTDLEDVAWAKEAIDALSRRKIVAGVGGGRFAPQDILTREQFAAIAVRAFGMYRAGAALDGFGDVPERSVYAPYIASARDAGLVQGVGGGRFGAGREISRQDMAVLVYRALRRLGVALPSARLPVAFADDGEIADYAREAVYALYGAGLLDGVDDGVFRPLGSATRAQAAKLIRDVLDVLGGVL